MPLVMNYKLLRSNAPVSRAAPCLHVLTLAVMSKL